MYCSCQVGINVVDDFVLHHQGIVVVVTIIVNVVVVVIVNAIAVVIVNVVALLHM